ncbi:hypothetical protein [Sphingobacterium wenxiniae]|uniref:Beta-glucosidase n=1 Tax=Sphingobacterium wenxiniae TaxID=683125 RepID=A0A1I6TEK7_9SPHI|nr:hypothetical protein [Sphingobacterium wenxiniae]SFS87548.1 beta-glucosidase [Sphingobacterium wenxiniae]
MPKPFYLSILGVALFVSTSYAQKIKDIYHDNWIDFNKNGVKDIYEDVNQPIEKRVEDLIAQMTPQEKANQTATLYGYGRILKANCQHRNGKTRFGYTDWQISMRC